MIALASAEPVIGKRGIPRLRCCLNIRIAARLKRPIPVGVIVGDTRGQHLDSLIRELSLPAKPPSNVVGCTIERYRYVRYRLTGWRRRWVGCGRAPACCPYACD